MLIKGGTVVTGDGSTSMAEGEVLIRDGRIAAVGRNLNAPDNDVVDASGQIVLPGAVNTHAHGCVQGALRAGGVTGFLGERRSSASSTGHLLGGETTVLCVCGFCLPREIAGRHPVRVGLATSPYAGEFFRSRHRRRAGSSTPEHRAMTAERALEDGAVALGEFGAGHSPAAAARTISTFRR